MTRPPSDAEERTVRALRDARAITGPEQDAALAALEATEPCDKCEATGNLGDCQGCCDKCDGTGQMRAIR